MFLMFSCMGYNLKKPKQTKQKKKAKKNDVFKLMKSIKKQNQQPTTKQAKNLQVKSDSPCISLCNSSPAWLACRSPLLVIGIFQSGIVSYA